MNHWLIVLLALTLPATAFAAAMAMVLRDLIRPLRALAGYEDHARLKNFVKTRVFAKRDAITERLSRMIDRYGRRVRVDRRAEPGVGIALEIAPDEALRVPSPSDVWDRRRRD